MGLIVIGHFKIATIELQLYETAFLLHGQIQITHLQSCRKMIAA